MPGTIALPSGEYDQTYDGHAAWCLRGHVAGMNLQTRGPCRIPSFSQRYDCPKCGLWKIKQRLSPYAEGDYHLVQMRAGSQQYRSRMKRETKGGLSVTFDDDVKFLMTDLVIPELPRHALVDIYRFLVRYQLNTATCRRIAFVAPWSKETKVSDTVWRPLRHKTPEDGRRYDFVISTLMEGWGGRVPDHMDGDQVFDLIEHLYEELFDDGEIDLMNPAG